MSLLATRDQARKIDERTQLKDGVTAKALMEEAGTACANELIKDFSEELKLKAVIFCGPGNNGGDGLVIARKLHDCGYKKIDVYLIGNQSSDLLKSLASSVKSLGINLKVIAENSDLFSLTGALNNCGIIVDAIFGTGLTRKIEGITKNVIEKLNDCGCKIVSVDVPSGLDCDRGAILGVAVKADTTYTIGISKPGFYIRQGPEHAGRIKVLPISFPREIIKEEAKTHRLFGRRGFKLSIPERTNLSNKSSFGRALIIAGSEGKWGAAVLAARAAFRAGAGYVVHVSSSDSSLMLNVVPEAMSLSPSELRDTVRKFKEKGLAVGIGPGLGVTPQTAEMIEVLVRENIDQVVVDADAITAALEYKLFPLPARWLLTPHAGELGRSLNISTEELENDPIYFAGVATKTLGAQILLKGYKTIIATGKKRIIINAGNSALAKAGTGDVLTGMITGFMAQGLPSAKAGAVAAYLHGKIADDWLLGKDQRTLTASDLIEEIPSAFERLLK